VSTNIIAQNIYAHIPHEIDTSKKYLFYLHGVIIENQGIKAVSEKYGAYEFEKILKSLTINNINVISETRHKNTDIFEYVKKSCFSNRYIIKSGVLPKNITVVGA
jgi:hypothetical protein